MKYTGSAIIRVDGAEIPSDGKGSLTPGGMAREVATDGTKTLGYTENYEPPVLKCKVRHGAAMSITALQDLTDATVMFETDTGKVFTLRGAFTTNALELSEGQVDLEMSAMSCDEE